MMPLPLKSTSAGAKLVIFISNVREAAFIILIYSYNQYFIFHKDVNRDRNHWKRSEGGLSQVGLANVGLAQAQVGLAQVVLIGVGLSRVGLGQTLSTLS